MAKKKERFQKAFQIHSVTVRGKQLTPAQEKQAKAEFSLLIRGKEVDSSFSLAEMVAEAEKNSWTAELARLDIALPRIKKQL